MTPLHKVTLSLSLACLMLMALFATIALAGPPTTPDIDGTIANDNVDWDSDELIVDDPIGDSPWGLNQELDNLYFTWDQTHLYVGISYTIDNNAMIVYIDTGQPGGEDNFLGSSGYSGAYPRNINFTDTTDIDLMLARWHNQVPQVYTIVDNSSTDISGSAVFSYTDTAVEYGVPFTQINLPYSTTLCLVTVLAGGDDWGAADSMPDNADTDGDGGPDTLDTLHCTSYQTDISINEVRIDQGGSDNDEYFELAGTPGTSLNGLTYLVIGDGAGGSGVIEAVVPLTGTVIPADGYYLALENSSMFTPTADLTTTLDFENGDNVTHLLVSGFTGSNGDDLDTNDDGVLDVTPWTDLLDLIALIEEENPPAGTEYHYGPPTVGPDGSFVPAQAYFCAVVGWQIGSFSTFDEDTPGAANSNCPTIEPDLTIDKTGPSIALPGDLITYTINYQNIGLTATSDATISDTLPASFVTYVADDSGLPCPACTLGATGTLTWTAGTVSTTDNLTFSLVALVTDTVPVGTILTNTAAIATSDNEITTTNNLSQWAMIVTSLDLAVTKDGPAFGMIGAPLAYTIDLQNVGIATATNVILTDVLPANTTYLSDDSGYACVACTPGATGTLTFTVGDLPANTTTSFALTVTVESSATSGEVLTNTITATTDTVGDNPGNNSDIAETAVYPFVPIHDIQFVPDPANDDASPFDGQIVWTAGTVTAQPGEIDTPSRLMVIQDPAGGPWSGVAIFRANGFGGLIAPEGTSVLVLGTVSEFFGFTELNLDNDPWAVQVVSTMPPLTPEVLTDTASFDDANAAVSEPWEGVLIEFQDSTVTNEDLGFGEWYHDDSSGPSRVDDLGEQDGNLTYAPTLGDQFRYLRGIGWYSFGNYKLEPRYDDDIALASDEPIITKVAPGIIGPNELYTYTITVENLLGYDLTGVAIGDLVPANATFAYALDGGSTIVSGTDTLVNWMIPTLPDQSTLDVRFAVTSTNTITEIVNEFYGVQAANYPTLTLGLPITTLVSSPLRIHDIQGEGHFSPYEGLLLLDIPGIVTAVRSNSFYMQDPNPDGSDGTSEGINVFVGGSPGVNVGDFVLVSGQVDEFYPGGIDTGNLPTTQISNPTVVISSTGHALPAATIIGTNGRIPPNSVIDDDGLSTFDHANDGIDFYESLEGMLVQVEDALVVGSKRFGEIQVVGDNGANATGLNARGGIVINENDFNPERIIIDDAIVFNEPFAEVGYSFTDIVTGVMDYSFGNFKLLNSEPLPPLTPGGLVSETSGLVATADHLTVASFNVLNLDPGDSTFPALADAIVNHLNAPDIIGLQEIQDNNGQTNDGTTDASLTYSTLITAIQNAGGPTYEYRDIAPENNMDGGVPGGNIRVGFLFQPARVTFVDRPGGTATNATTPQLGPSGVELTYSPGRIEPTNIAFTDSRKPLAGEFIFNNQKLIVAVNHFNSKGGDDPLFGVNQPPVLHSEVQRLQQAQVVHDFVNSILDIDANANVIVLGDLNDFQFSPPLMTLQGSILTNLIDMLPGGEQYTFIFDGNSQVLDHILATDNLAATADVDVVHVNAEFDESRRGSDHEPVLARFELPFVPDVGPTAVSLSGPTTGMTSTTYTFAASVLPPSTTLPITFTWTADEQTTQSHLLLSTSDSITYSWATTGTKMIMVTAENSAGSVNATHTIVITAPVAPPPSFDLYLPFVPKESMAAGGQGAVAATPADSNSNNLALASIALFPTLLGLGWLPARRRNRPK